MVTSFYQRKRLLTLTLTWFYFRGNSYKETMNLCYKVTDLYKKIWICITESLILDEFTNVNDLITVWIRYDMGY